MDCFTYTDALLVQHCAVMGRMETRIRAYQIGPVRPYSSNEVAIQVFSIEPRKMSARYCTIKSDNLRYATIEVAGSVIYDSRSDIPCDMEIWETTNLRFLNNRGFSVVRP